jgi:RNA polymerase sigma-70 factor (ECF subfamily)
MHHDGLAPAPDETALVARVRAGDDAALETIFRAYALRLCTYAFRYVRSRETAAELVHDVFLKILRSRERWAIEESLAAYLFRATRNRALDYLKHRRIERRWEARAAWEQRLDDAHVAAAIDEAVERGDLTAALERALTLLPERRRLVFVLRWRDGMRYEEIATLLGISTKTVENQIGRAIQMLRAHLAPYL